MNDPVSENPDQKEPDTPPNIGMNLGFDDLLDNRKLKPVNDNFGLDDAASAGGESHSTIKHGVSDDYGGYSEPNSPDYRSFKPVAASPPDSPLPSTFQKDRERRKLERSRDRVSVNGQDTISHQLTCGSR